jgi:hypothetical protein
MGEVVSLEGPVEVIDGELAILIPSPDPGHRGTGYIDDAW